MSRRDDVLISIVVPIYKVEKYIDRCLESLITQTYERIEIICVDDGSPDQSGNLAEKYANLDNRIHVVHKENEGLGLARNYGMKFCKGEFITFVDSDDYIEPDLIEQLVIGYKNNDADTVIAGYSRSRDGEIEKELNPIANKVFEGSEIMTNLLVRMIGSSGDENDSINMAAWRVLYSRMIIFSNNLEFPSERNLISEDIIFNLHYYRFAKRVSGIDNCGYIYCLNPGSLTERYNKDRFKLGKILYYEEIKLLKELPDYGDGIYRAEVAFLNYTRYVIKSEVKFSNRNGKKNTVCNIEVIVHDEDLNKLIKRHKSDKKEKVDTVIDFFIQKHASRLIYSFLKLGYAVKQKVR